MLFVIIPTLILGPILFSLLLSNKKLRDPPSILFMCTTVLCMVGPLTYGLLMDISLFTGLPIVGSCGTETPPLVWVFFTLFHLQLLVSTAYLSLTQYITIRWGPSKLSTAKTVVIFCILFVYSSLGSLVNLLYNSPENIKHAITVRGSLCFFPIETVLIPLVVLVIQSVLMYVLPTVILVTVFSVLSFRYVKRYILENGDVVRNVFKIMITITVSSVVFRFLPVINALLFIIGSPTNIDFVVNYSIELNYPLFLILTIFVHKSVRRALLKHLKCSSVKGIFGIPSNQVTSSSTQPTL